MSIPCWLTPPSYFPSLCRAFSLCCTPNTSNVMRVFWCDVRNRATFMIVMSYAQIALNFSCNSLSIPSSTSYTRQSLSVTPRGRENVGASPCVSSSSNSPNPLSTSGRSSSTSAAASFDAFVNSCSIAPRTVVSERMKSSNRYLEVASANNPKENRCRGSPYVTPSDTVCSCECRYLSVHIEVVDVGIQREATLAAFSGHNKAFHRGCCVLVEVDSGT